MFLGHIAVALARKRAAPSVSPATWIAGAQVVDLLWPFFLLAGLEHVRIAPGISAFSPLDFTEYPITHGPLLPLAWLADREGDNFQLPTSSSRRAIRRARADRRSDWTRCSDLTRFVVRILLGSWKLVAGSWTLVADTDTRLT